MTKRDPPPHASIDVINETLAHAFPTGDTPGRAIGQRFDQAGMFGYLEVKANVSISTQSATVTPRAGQHAGAGAACDRLAHA